MVGETLQEKMRQALHSVHSIRAAAGSAFERVVKTAGLPVRPGLCREMVLVPAGGVEPPRHLGCGF